MIEAGVLCKAITELIRLEVNTRSQILSSARLPARIRLVPRRLGEDERQSAKIGDIRKDQPGAHERTEPEAGGVHPGTDGETEQHQGADDDAHLAVE